MLLRSKLIYALFINMHCCKIRFIHNVTTEGMIQILKWVIYFRAQSGTGKTATFAISILQILDTQLRDTQALVLSPTRELAVQIQKVCI